MTWTENEFSNIIKSMRGSLSEINEFEKKSSPRKDSYSLFNANPEPKNYMHQLISRINEPKLKPFGDLLKMQKNSNGTRSSKNFLKRSQSTNTGSHTGSDSKSTSSKTKDLVMIIRNSHFTFPKTFEKLQETEFASRECYRDDAISTASDSAPLLPLNVPLCREAHENELFLSNSPSSTSLASSDKSHVLTNLDSLSICEDNEVEIPPRISMMNDAEKKKTKQNVKSMYNIKTISVSDNKELNAAIQIAQNASLCLGNNKKSNQTRTCPDKRSRWKVSHHREDRKAFSEDTRLRDDYHSTPNEQLTYNELISKPSNIDTLLAEDIRSDRLCSTGPKTRQHSSLSDSENLLNFTESLYGKDCLLTSRSDGTEVYQFDKWKLHPHKCMDMCRHKSYLSDMGPNHISKQLAISRAVTTSSRSLPTCLESNSRTFFLERQVSTPLPSSSVVLSKLNESEHVPPLPSKGGSRSNLSTSDLRNQSPVGPSVFHFHATPLKENSSTNTNHGWFPSSTISQEKTANREGAIHADPMQTPTSPPPPPLPSRTFHQANQHFVKGPPLPPKSVLHCPTASHRNQSFSHRPSSEESDNTEEISSSSESSNFASSIDSEGLEQYSETCICRQFHVSKTSPSSGPLICHSNHDRSSLQSNSDDGLIKKACEPMPGRYETSDSLVYDYIDNPTLDFHSRDCQYITDKVDIIKKHFPEVSTNDLECALIENNYSVEETIKHLTLKFSLTSSTFSSNDLTCCIMVQHRHHFVPDPMGV